MNDDFLQRLRKPPPPEFLDKLKARLDRQPLPPPQPRRFAFSRGMVLGFVLGVAAIAIAVTSIPGVSGSLRALLQAPGRFVARHWLYGPRTQDSNQHKVVPLGPVWLPEHPGRPPDRQVAAASASFKAQAGDHSHETNAAANGTAPRPGIQPPTTLLIVASQTALTHATYALEHMDCCSGYLKLEPDTGAVPFEKMCTLPTTAAAAAIANATPTPAAMELSRRIPPEEMRNCTPILKTVELKLGYQAIVLGRAKLYGPLRLTRRSVFLALAKRIPDPNHSGALMDNPNTTWSQVDPAIPYESDRIQVFGPPPGSVPGKLAAQLLLEAGCNSYPWIAALHDRDPDRYREICTTLRDDGAYTPAGVSGWAYADELVGNPTALGVFSTDEFAAVKDKLSASPLDGAEPSPASFASGGYPASRTFYLYTTPYRARNNPGLVAFVRSNMEQTNFYSNDPNGWGFTPLDPAERAAAMKDLTN